MTQSILKRFSYLLNLTRTMFLFFNTPSVKTAMYVSLLFLLRKSAFPSRKNPRGEFPYKNDGMFRLGLGSEISDCGLTWGVWDGTSLYLPIQVSLRAVHKEINEKYRDFWSPLGVSLSLSHTHIGLLLIFRRASPSLLHGSSPPPGKNLDCFRTYESTCNVNFA